MAGPTAGFSGDQLLIKVEDTVTAGTYNTVAGLRDTSLTENGEPIDISNKSSGKFKELLEGGGSYEVQVSGSGVFTSDAALAQLTANVRSQAANINYRICHSDGASYIEGCFQVTSIQLQGTYNGEQNYSISMQSNGTMTYV